MTTKVLTNVYLALNGTEVSSSGVQANLTYEADSLDETAFGADTHKNKGGLKNWSLDLNFNQDYTDNGLDETLFGLVGSQVTVAVRPENTTIGTGNPEYTGTGLVQSYSVLSGNVGDLARTPVKIVAAGTLSRDVTP